MPRMPKKIADALDAGGLPESDPAAAAREQAELAAKTAKRDPGSAKDYREELALSITQAALARETLAGGTAKPDEAPPPPRLSGSSIAVPPAEIAAALVKAQRAIVGVEKTATSHHGNYASTESMIAESRRALGLAGLALLTTSWEVFHADDGGTGILETHWLLVHESGTTWAPGCSRCPVMVDRARPPDKAMAAALTYSTGYYLRGLLLIPRVKPEEEVDQRDDSTFEPPRRERRPEPKPAEPTLRPSSILRVGSGKGQAVVNASVEALLEARAQAEKYVADPKHGAQARQDLAAYEAEIQKRMDREAAQKRADATTDRLAQAANQKQTTYPSAETIDPETGEVREDDIPF